jgi:hypothetical protein
MAVDAEEKTDGVFGTVPYGQKISRLVIAGCNGT